MFNTCFAQQITVGAPAEPSPLETFPVHWISAILGAHNELGTAARRTDKMAEGKWRPAASMLVGIGRVPSEETHSGGEDPTLVTLHLHAGAGPLPRGGRLS